MALVSQDKFWELSQLGFMRHMSASPDISHGKLHNIDKMLVK